MSVVFVPLPLFFPFPPGLAVQYNFKCCIVGMESIIFTVNLKANEVKLKEKGNIKGVEYLLNKRKLLLPAYTS